MDKLVEHAIRMLEIVEGENDFYRNDAKRQADIARAVYDTILRVQILERKADRKDEQQADYDKGLKLFAEMLFDKEKSEQFLKECKAMGIEPQTDCDGCQHYADEHTADACYECSRSYVDCYEPQTERSIE